MKILISTMTGSLELIHNAMEPGLGSKLTQIAKLTTDNLQRNLDNIRHLSYIEGSLPEPEFGPASIGNLFNNMWENISLMIKKNNLEGKLNIDPTFPECVHLEANKVKQVVFNLVDFLIQRGGGSTLNMKAVHIDPFMDDNFCIEEYSLGQELIYRSEKSIDQDVESSLSSLTSMGTYNLKSAEKKPVIVRNKNSKMLKIVVSNFSLDKPDCNKEGFLREIDDIAEIINGPQNEMAKLSMVVNRMICDQLGGKLQTQVGSKNELVFTAYLPFEFYAKNQVRRRAGHGFW